MTTNYNELLLTSYCSEVKKLIHKIAALTATYEGGIRSLASLLRSSPPLGSEYGPGTLGAENAGSEGPDPLPYRRPQTLIRRLTLASWRT